jgi:hypothetical protein
MPQADGEVESLVLSRERSVKARTECPIPKIQDEKESSPPGQLSGSLCRDEPDLCAPLPHTFHLALALALDNIESRPETEQPADRTGQ